jgi:excisionase family DNA binding protein
MQEHKAFTCAETAQAVGISVPMVRKLIRVGRLRAVKIGRCVRIPEAELQRILRQGTGDSHK